MKPKPGTTTEDADRAQVGIGTMIIFIALVLVAAVAAGVLINTSGALEQRASDTGQEAETSVANQIDVVTTVGEVDDTNNAVDTMNLTVKKSAGADNLDVANATIEYLSDDASATLHYLDADPSNASDTEFVTDTLVGDGTVLTDAEDRVRIVINASAVEGDDEGLDPSDRVTLRLVDQSGATTTYGATVPQTVEGKNFVGL